MTWRILVTPPATGEWNMALDEALLMSTSSGKSLPTLRLYDWQPACLSLGYSQPFSEVNLSALSQYGWTYVRRPTGGRAILHRDEITYSITAPQSHPFVAGSLMESYRNISRILVMALENFGIDVRADKEYELLTKEQKKAPVCFENPSNYEITANGKKLIGSAQARKYNGVLQHGSLPLIGDIGLITRVLNLPDETQAYQKVLSHATTLEEVLQKKISWQEAAENIKNAFIQVVEEDVVEIGLLEAEEELARQLLKTKYSTPAWNQRI